MIFNRNPFYEFDHLQRSQNISFFGSKDGGNWKRGAQGLQFKECYGPDFTTKHFTESVWNTPNGNCGLWAGNYDQTKCILQCMKGQFLSPPVYGKGHQMPCDMAVHDYCVYFGGCFSNTTVGEFSPHVPPLGVAWADETHSRGIFGPTVPETAKQNACIDDKWTVAHYRCGKRQRHPICYNHSSLNTNGSTMHKYLQVGYPNHKRCLLNSTTNLPLPNK